MLHRKRRLIALISVLLVAGFLVTSFAAYYVSLYSLREQITQSELPLTSDTIYSEIQRDLLRPIFISSLMANDTFVREWVLSGERDEEKIKRYLHLIQQEYGTVTSFFISDKSANYYHPSRSTRTVNPARAIDRWYYRVRNLSEPFEVNIDIDQANNDEVTIFINYRVVDDQHGFMGITGVGLSLTSVKAMISRYQQRFNRNIYFVNQAGDITLSGLPLHPTVRNIQQVDGLGDYVSDILAGTDQRLSYRRDGATYHLYTRFIPEFNWILMVEQAEQQTMQDAYHTLLLNLVICVCVTGVVVGITNWTLGKYQDQLELMATTDKLTGLYNRHAFDLLMDSTLRDVRRNQQPCSVLLFDVDHFKRVNDRFGHSTGDRVLRHVAAMVKCRCRDVDTVCRWGGEEFLVLLKGCPLAKARRIADDLRQLIFTTPMPLGEQMLTVSVSIGVTALMEADNKETVVARADAAMYQAKQEGRNRVSVATLGSMVAPVSG